MAVKVAYLKYAEKHADIPIKFDIFRRNEKLFDWYIKRYNPFIIEEGENSCVYKVVVPFLNDEQTAKREKAQTVLEKTLRALVDMDIQYIVPPTKFRLTLPDIIPIANHNSLFPFLINQSVLKALLIANKDIKDAEILIIDGNSYITEILLDNICGNVNYLTVMTEEHNLEFYKAMAEEVFDDNGLLIQTVLPNKNYVQTADVIINTSNQDYKFDYSFKKGAIYFELSEDAVRAKEIFAKRPDMILVDNLKIKMNEKIFDFKMFEAYFYSISSDYRYMLNRRYSVETGKDILKKLKCLDIRIKSLCFNDRIVSSTAKV